MRWGIVANLRNLTFWAELRRTLLIALVFLVVTVLMVMSQMTSDKWFDTYRRGLLRGFDDEPVSNIYAWEPLHDYLFQALPDLSEYIRWLSDLFITTLLTLTIIFTVIWIRKPRLPYQGFIVIRRVLTSIGMMYLMRAVCILVTTVPPTRKECVPKYVMGSNPFDHIVMIVNLITGKASACTDNIYSGHAILLTTLMMTCIVYSGRRWLALYALVHGSIGLLSIALIRMHYTVDILVAVIICAFTFVLYHILLMVYVDSALLKQLTVDQALLSGGQASLIQERSLLLHTIWGGLKSALWWLDGMDLRFRRPSLSVPLIPVAQSRSESPPRMPAV